MELRNLGERTSKGHALAKYRAHTRLTRQRGIGQMTGAVLQGRRRRSLDYHHTVHADVRSVEQRDGFARLDHTACWRSLCRKLRAQRCIQSVLRALLLEAAENNGVQNQPQHEQTKEASARPWQRPAPAGSSGRTRRTAVDRRYRSAARQPDAHLDDVRARSPDGSTNSVAVTVLDRPIRRRARTSPTASTTSDAVPPAAATISSPGTRPPMAPTLDVGVVPAATAYVGVAAALDGTSCAPEPATPGVG